MERQLIKVAKELNIGMGTIVEYLTDKGFDVENKPNAKLSDGMYDALMKKFSDSKAEKQKADQIVIGTRPVAKPLTPSVQTPPQQPVTQEKKTINLFPPKEVPKTEEKPVVKPAPEIVSERPTAQMPKVLGKIDLSPAKKEPVSIAPPPPQVQQEPAVAPQTQKVEEKQQAEPVQPQAVQPPKQNIVLQPTIHSNQQQQPKQQPQQQQPKQQPQQQQKPQQPQQQQQHRQQHHNEANKQNFSQKPQYIQQPEKKQEPVKPVVIVPKDTTPAQEPESRIAGDIDNDELIRAEAPQLRGLKIKGKIDIDKFIEKDKGSGGGSNDRNRNKNRGKGGNNNNNRPGDRPASGTPGTPKPQTGTGTTTNDSADARKRKRKRKKIPTSPNPQGAAGATTGGNQQNTGNRTGSNDRPRTPDNKAGAPPRRTEPAPISQQQIEAKIKETMARLNIGGKNKGQKIRRDKRDKNRERAELNQLEADNAKLQVTEFISVSDLASVMDIAPTQIITTCMSLGIFVSINQRLDAELIEVIASEFGKEVEFISAEEQVGATIEDEPDAPEDLVPRAPVVTIMGHVDHGKTSLLDYVRKADVASGEAGGITQHIGAYEVKLANGRKITFLDTPGHEAFTAMRARGAKVTDVAVIIIAADDSIMPQTKEAISHAQAAGVPIIFAINKIDKPGADPNRIKNELAQMNLLVEEWGGKFQSQDISAKQGIGIEELLEKILLEAEILDLKANPNKRATGTVIEASLDKGRGYVSKMLVQAGTLKIGDPMVAGEHAGKVKAMYNERGKKVLQAGPATPVLVLGLSGAPQAGEIFKIMPSEAESKEIANKRAQIVREQSARATKRISLDEIGRRLALGTFKELNLIIKGDVDGSVEALSDSLLKQSHETVQVNVIHKAVGAISESDVMLASASDAIIIGFQVRPSLNARKLAEREGVEIKLYSVIYEAIQEIRSAIEGMLEPTKEEKILGTVEVREVYKISKVGTVAGCYVQEGKIERKNLVRIIRDGIVIFPVKEGQTSQLASLKRFKEDAKEVKSGFECGLTLDNFNDIQVGDFIEAYEIIEVKQKL